MMLINNKFIIFTLIILSGCASINNYIDTAARSDVMIIDKLGATDYLILDQVIAEVKLEKVEVVPLRDPWQLSTKLRNISNNELNISLRPTQLGKQTLNLEKVNVILLQGESKIINFGIITPTALPKNSELKFRIQNKEAHFERKFYFF